MDHPVGGRVQVVAPQEVVRRLLVGRLLERVDAHALRVRAAEHVGDGGVLARRVDPLQHHEQRPLLLGVQARLQVGDPLDQVGELGVVGVVAGVGRVEVGERERGHVVALPTMTEVHVHGPYATVRG